MSEKLRTILDLLSCPVEEKPLRLDREQPVGRGCSRSFPLLEDLAEIVPAEIVPPEILRRYPARLPASASADCSGRVLVPKT
jgi:uncharacterized protein YbaR (Trm112 family)